MNKLGISVVIPCLNEERTLGEAIKRAFEGLSNVSEILACEVKSEVIVVDNASTDTSSKVAEKFGARIILEPVRGYGASLHAGIKQARFSNIVFADADLSYPLENLADLVLPLIQDKADFVLGSRIKGNIEKGAMPFLNRYLGTPLLSHVLRFFYKLKTTDCNSGMRAFRREHYDELGIKSKGMEYASEMLVKVSQTGLRYFEVPIDYKKDQRERRSHLRPFRDGFRHLFILVKLSAMLRFFP